MTKRYLISLVLPVSLYLGACKSGHGPEALDVESAAAICSDFCAHEETCDRASSDCVESCTRLATTWIRGDVFSHVVECTLDLTCAELEHGRDEQCWSSIEPLPVHHELEARCLEKFRECDQPARESAAFCDFNDSEDGVTSLYILLTPTIVIDLIACFDIDCSELVDIGDCFDWVFAEHGFY